MSKSKTIILDEDNNKGIFQKLWIVGDRSGRRVMNYIGETLAFDPMHRNEERTSYLCDSPKYFGTYAEARACAKFWNEKIPWKYDPSKKVARHGMNCAFKPILVKVTLA